MCSEYLHTSATQKCPVCVIDRAQMSFDRIDREVLNRIARDVREIKHILHPKLTRTEITFQGDSMATPGPVTLTSAGQTVTASVVGFDRVRPTIHRHHSHASIQFGRYFGRDCHIRSIDRPCNRSGERCSKHHSFADQR